MAALKHGAAADFYLFGSADLAVTFTRAGLIDEYRLIVNPVVLGRGVPHFKGEERLRLRLAGHRTFANGNVLLRYEPGKAVDRPPGAAPSGEMSMCRNIQTLYNFEPPASDDEVRAAALQYVRKISGFAKPSAANQEAFARAVDQVARASSSLLGALVTAAPPRDREVEAAKARARAVRRFGS